MDAPALGTRLCKELDAAEEGMGQGGPHLAAEPKQGLLDPSEPKRGRSCKICSHTRGQSLVQMASSKTCVWKRGQAASPSRCAKVRRAGRETSLTWLFNEVELGAAWRHRGWA